MSAPHTKPDRPNPDKLANRIALLALAVMLALCWATADGAFYGAQMP